MRSRRGKFALLACLVLAAGAAFWGVQGERSAVRPSPRNVAAPPPALVPLPSAVSPPSQIPEASHGPLPESLRGTEADGRLEVDSDGRLVPGPGLLLMFDYFLAASGEESDEVIRGRILLELRENLPPRAAAQAEALLDHYLAYREEVRQLAQANAAPQSLERRVQWLRELRRDHFDAATAEALFGAQERSTRLALERRQVALDPDLDDAERQRRLEALDARQPAAARAVRERSEAPRRIDAEVEALRGAGAGEHEVFEARERAFGADAARRLAQLDAKRARFAERLAAWREVRDAALAGAGASDPESVLAALRAERFTAPERIRVRALDALDLEANAK